MRLLFIIPLLFGCAQSPVIKIYSSQPGQGGMVRKQDKEAVKYDDTKGWICLTPEDAKILFENYSHE